MRMYRFLSAIVLAAVFVSALSAGEQAKQAPCVVLKSVDGKKAVDLGKLVADGPVLVRLTCACSGCDKELPYFQKLDAAYCGKGLKTVAVFQETAETAGKYVAEKGVSFSWLADPNRDAWKIFDATAMPTNILIDKGGRIVKVVPGCTRDGKNAQLLSAEVAKILKTDVVSVISTGSKSGK
jgi:peroxiredoxin